MQAAKATGRAVRAQDDAPGSAPLKNPQHEKLAREFAAGASMADAWRAIGRNPAIGNQSRAFRRPEIQARVEYLRGEFNRMAGISLAALQARLLRIADANVVNFFETDERGRMHLRDLTALPRSVTAPIAELRLDADGAVKVKTCDKLHAIDSLLKTIGGFAPEGPEQGATLEDLVMRSMELRKEMHLSVITGVPRAPDEPAAASAQSAAPTNHGSVTEAGGVRRVRL
jgi:hypothetical protein